MTYRTTRLLSILALTAVLFTLTLTTLRLQATDNTLYLIRISYNNIDELNRLMHHDIWETDVQNQTVLISGDIYLLQALQTDGWQAQIDKQATAEQLNNSRAIDTFNSGYRTVTELYTALQTISQTYPTLVELVDYGDSHCLAESGCTVPVTTTTPASTTIAGYDLHAIRLTNESISGTSTISGTSVVSGTKPVLFLMAAIHAREITTPEVAMRFIDWLLAGYGSDADITWLLDYHEIWVVPVANPDGHHIVWLGTQPPYSSTPFYHRKNSRDSGCTTWPSISNNHYGVDLNRNHTSGEWGTIGIDSWNCGATYPGTAAGSEVEIQHLETLIQALIPDQRGPNINDVAPSDTKGLFITLHSSGRFVVWPWGNSYNQITANNTEMAMIGEKFASYNQYTACRPGSSGCLGVVSGASEDWAYEKLGIPAYTFELGTTFFASFSEMENIQWPRNRPAFFYAAKIADAPYQRIHGPDVGSIITDTNGYTITITAVLSDTETGGQSIANGRYSLGAPLNHTPQLSGTLPLLDGVADSTTDTVQATIDASGLLSGTYPLFIYGVDSDGNEGPPTAVWVTIPVTTLTLSGGGTQMEGDSGTSTVTFTATLNITTTGSFTVSYTTQDGTAAAPSDYATNSDILTFTGNANETQTIPLTLYGDTDPEPDETLTITLSTPSLENIIVEGSPQTVTITNDDPHIRYLPLVRR